MNIEEVHRRLLEVVGSQTPIHNEMAKVIAVDKEKMECTVVPIKNEELIIEEVNLKAVIDTTLNGFIKIPRIDSVVLIGTIENIDGDHYIAMYSDIDEIILVQEGVEIFKIDNKGSVSFHEGKTSGMINAKELKSQLDKNTNAIQKILDMFSNWKAVPQDGGKALELLGAKLLDTQVGDFSNIENDKVKH